MSDWFEFLSRLQVQAAGVPKILWAVGAAILVSLVAATWLEMSGPPYAVLEEGLSPADGGKVIAQLQKLGIAYQLQAAGDVILVPTPQLAQARLQLGQAQVPGSDVATAWSQLENAPMTASDLAQSTMAGQALELSLQQSIEGMNGIRSAQVFLAVPPDTPFLADQPKPAASVVVQADDGAGQAQGEAIASMVAGAVPGLAASQVTVETTAGVTLYPTGSRMATANQLGTTEAVENNAAARIAGLLIPLVGAGNFQTDVSANLDFTQEHIHQIAYGPTHLVTHQVSELSDQWGAPTAALGIPGALSNEPPTATTATTAAAPVAGKGAAAAGAANPQGQPQQTRSDLDQTYVTDQSDSDIVNPDWTVKSVSISVVLNKAALGEVSLAQVKMAIAGAFAYPAVNVSVLAARFLPQPKAFNAGPLIGAIPPLAHGLLEVMAAGAVLFGLALPAGRRLGSLNLQSFLPTPQRPLPAVLPPRDFSDLREQASENVPGVARLLQSWAEDSE